MLHGCRDGNSASEILEQHCCCVPAHSDERPWLVGRSIYDYEYNRGWKNRVGAQAQVHLGRSARAVRSKGASTCRHGLVGCREAGRSRGVVMPVFDRGDVVNVPLDPAVGHEQKGTRPALVLTTKEFNQLGDVLVAPVTQGGDFSRYAGFAVSLTGTGCNTLRRGKRAKSSEYHRKC